MKHNQKLGRFGEQAAAAWVTAKGYQVVALNARTPYGEIDLVAKRNEITVFIEVKTRSNRSFGTPETAITPRKLEHLTAAAAFYAAEHGIEHWQIDVLAIEKFPGKSASFEHFENIHE